MLAWDGRHVEHRNGPVWNVGLLCLMRCVLCERTNHSFEGAQCEAATNHSFEGTQCETAILHVLFLAS